MGDPALCSIDGCDYPIKSRGWCQAHYMRWWATGDTGPAEVVRRPKGRTCSLEGCDRKHSGRGYCNTHLQRFIKYGDPGPAEIELRAPNRGCKVEDCEGKHSGRGFCARHLQMITKRGTLEPPAHGKRWIGDAAGYGTVHARLRNQRGKASGHICVQCGEQAQQWAYDHRDPDQRIDDKTGKPYSLDLDHYLPMCKTCHRRMDAERTKFTGCIVEGCERTDHKARRLCSAHYQQWRAGRLSI